MRLDAFDAQPMKFRSTHLCGRDCWKMISYSNFLSFFIWWGVSTAPSMIFQNFSTCNAHSCIITLYLTRFFLKKNLKLQTHCGWHLHLQKTKERMCHKKDNFWIILLVDDKITSAVFQGLCTLVILPFHIISWNGSRKEQRLYDIFRKQRTHSDNWRELTS